MKVKTGSSSALVLEIQKMSTEDGPGLRTTLFLKGCSLSCRWCHNPESISTAPQVRWIETRCIGCDECTDICRLSALSRGAGGIEINRNLCSGCGECAAVCPSSALELWGKRMSADEACAELVKDRAYFGRDGGVTISGGEAALQADFVSGLFGRLRAGGIHTALDTCGACSPRQLEVSCLDADLILFDLKESDPSLHRQFTGGSLEIVQDSFRRVVEIVKKSRLDAQAWPQQRPKELWIRTPVIPGLTAREENIRAIAGFLLKEGDGLWDRWELCAFNNLCRDKYLSLGRDWELGSSALMSRTEMDRLMAAAADEGIDKKMVGWTGTVTQED